MKKFLLSLVALFMGIISVHAEEATLSFADKANRTTFTTSQQGTHTVLSGHRGLPSARLFTDLDQMEPDDLFVIRVMDRVMTYMVDQILIVLPEEMDGLAIDPGEDYCTLVTCTPYGINSHRLLVRGKRTDNVEMPWWWSRLPAPAAARWPPA